MIIANQEGPISNNESAIGGKCCLKSAPQTAEILRKWGIGIVSLANNHMFDYGWEGFEQTRNYLDKTGIRYLGAGRDLAEARKPLIVDIKGTKIGLLSYSWQFVQTTCATQQSYGCAPLEIKLMTSQIQQLSRDVDTVIVLPHWGYCEYLLPTPEQVELGKRIVSEKAAAVIGHHSHIVQGVTKEDDSLLAYSLGNFAFAEYSDRGQPVHMTRGNMEGIILKVEIQAGKVVSYNPVFTILEDGLVQVDSSKRRLEEFKKRCAELKLANYVKHWRKYVRARMLKRILYWANVLNWRYAHRETLVGGWLMLKSIFRGDRRDKNPASSK